MEAWNIEKYSNPRLKLVDSVNLTHTNVIVIESQNNNYDIEFFDVDANAILDTINLMRTPNSSIWNKLKKGSACDWECNLAMQLDILSLIEEIDVNFTHIEDIEKWITQMIDDASQILFLNINNKSELYFDKLIYLQELFSKNIEICGDEFLVDIIGIKFKDNFALQTIYLQYIYVCENLPPIKMIWRLIIHKTLSLLGWDKINGVININQSIELKLTAANLYEKKDISCYIMCLTYFVLFLGNEKSNRLDIYQDLVDCPNSGLNFMQMAEHQARKTLSNLGNNKYLEILSSSDITFGPVVQGIFIEQFHITVRFVEIIAPFMMKRFIPAIRNRVFRYFQEEFGHEEFELNSCEALGVDVSELSQSISLPILQAYIDAFTVIGKFDPIGYISAIMVTEGMLGTESPIHEKLEMLANSKMDYKKVAKRHDDLNLKLNHASLSRLFFKEIPLITANSQNIALKNLVYMLELNFRGLDQAACFYNAQPELNLCRWDNWSNLFKSNILF